MNNGTGVTLETTATGTSGSGTQSSGDGDIIIASPLSWNSAATLTLDAYHSVLVDANIAGTNLAVNYNYDRSTNTYDSSRGGNFTVASGSAVTLSNPTSGGSASLAINGTNYTLITSLNQFTSWNGNSAYALNTDLTAGTYNAAVIDTLSGAFEGLGHTISGLSISAGSTDKVGLFGTIASTGLVCNLILENASVSGNNFVGALAGWNDGTIFHVAANSSSVTGNGDVGGLVGWNGTGTIMTSYATGAVNGGSGGSGGLVGCNYDGTITSSYATGRVSGDQDVGGLVGENYDGTITNSYATSTTTGSNKVGGLAGSNYGRITSSYATGAVTGGSGSNDIGGLVGWNGIGGTISNCYWDVDTSHQVNGVGYISGGTGSPTALHSSTSGASAFSQSSYNGFDTNTWYMVDGYTRPFLRSEYSNTITNAHQLQLMALNLGVSYTLANNIDMSELTNASGLWRTASTADSNGNYGFVPVGSVAAAFTGTLDGGNHSISGLTINRPGTSGVGLFGIAGNIALSNVILKNASISGGSDVGALAGDVGAGSLSNCYLEDSTVNGAHEVGGLVGYLGSGSLSNCYNENGTVNTTTAADYYVGGLVGHGGGYSAALTIKDSHNSAAITVGDASYGVGGLIGRADRQLTIQDSDNKGNITGGNNGIGGLIGQAPVNALLENSNNTGNITASSNSSSYGYIGGIAGTTAQNATIEKCQNSGTVTGYQYVGGFVGYAESGLSISGSSNQGTVTANGIYVGGLVGYAEPSLNISDSYNTGSVESTQSGCVGGLVGFADTGGDINNSYSITGTVKGNFAVGGLLGYGVAMTVDKCFSANAVTGTDAVGGLVGYDKSGSTVSNSYSTGAVTTANGTRVGGLIGAASAGTTVENCYSTGAVTGGDYVGGLIGKAYINPTAGGTTGCSITDTYSTGLVTGSGSNVGGLIGYAESSTITDSYWDTSASHQSNGVGQAGSGNNGSATGLTTRQWLTQGPIAQGVWDANAWAAGYPYPVLKALPYVVVSTSGAQTYGDTSPVISGSYSITDQNGNDAGNLVSGTISWLTSADHNSSAGGSYVLGGTGATVNPGYQITYNGTVTVNKAKLTVTANDAGKTYDGQAYGGGSGISYSGFVNNEDASVLTGSVSYGGSSQGAKNAGNYSIDVTGSSLSSGNYDITYVNGKLTITPATLTVTANDVVKTYDGTSAVTGGSATAAGGTRLYGTDRLSGGTFAFTDKNAGSGDKTVTVDGVTVNDGNGGRNYTVKYVNNTTSTINKAQLTVTANDAAKTYDGQAYSDGSGVTYGSFVNGEDAGGVLTGSVSYGGSSQGAKNAGSYDIDITGSSLSSGNYTIRYVNGKLTIQPAPFSNDAYRGAIGTARQFALPVFGNPNHGGLSVLETVLPLTIIPPGVNTGGYVPLTVLGNGEQPEK